MKATISLLMAGGALAMISPTNLRLMTRKYEARSVGDGLIDSMVDVNMRERRQLSSGEIASKSMTGQNATAWDITTQNACMEAINAKKGKVSNPTGMAVCYNIPFLNENSGVFEADLRVYMVAPNTGEFANIPTDRFQVGLSYNGATVSPINSSSLVRRTNDNESSLSLSTDIKKVTVKRQVTPMMVQRYGFVGQVNKSLLPSNANALQKILVPNVTVSAVDPTGAKIQTSLSSDEVNFVSGVFARKELGPTKALLAPPIQTLVVESDKPFILPGLNILIFPVGLLVTGTWTILMIITIGYGTFERIQWRERFREAKMRETTMSIKRI